MRHIAAAAGRREKEGNVTNLRSVEANHAWADAEQKILAANGEVVLAVHVTNLLRRDGDEWRLVDSRPYAFATPPA